MDGKFTFQAIADLLHFRLPQNICGTDRPHRVLTQSEYAAPGDIIINAGWYHHSRIIPSSLKKGVALVLCDTETKKLYPDERVIVIDDPMGAVTKVEKFLAKPYHPVRIAITGSVGKTTTTGLINSMVAVTYKTLTHHTMSNSHGAILRNLQTLTADHEYWVQEVGGVQPGYIESTARFLCPDIVVLTNIGESHIDLYGSKQNIFWDKSSLERYAAPNAKIIINYDDDVLRNAAYSHTVITCSKTDSSADYYAKDIHTELDGLYFTAVCKEESIPVHLNLYGEHNVYDALFAIAVGRLADIPLKKMPEMLNTYRPEGIRQHLCQVGGYSFFIDTYSAAPKTVLGAAETLVQVPMLGKGRKIFVTGQIDRIGDASPRLHYELGKDLAKLDLDLFAFYLGDSKYTYKAMQEAGCTNIYFTESREEMDQWIRDTVTKEDLVFFKSGQITACLSKTVDHVFGTAFQNNLQFNEGTVAERDGFKYRLRKDNIAELCGYTGNETDLVIPAKYDAYDVIRVAPGAFARFRKLRSVTLPDSIVNIGQRAFYLCTKLEEVKLPASLKIIGKSAFSYCKALKHVEIPEGTIHIDSRAFFECPSLRSVSVPGSVGYLGENVFGTNKVFRKNATAFTCAPGSLAAAYIEKNVLAVSSSFLESVHNGSAQKTARSQIRSLAKRVKGFAKRSMKRAKRAVKKCLRLFRKRR